MATVGDRADNFVKIILLMGTVHLPISVIVVFPAVFELNSSIYMVRGDQKIWIWGQNGRALVSSLQHAKS